MSNICNPVAAAELVGREYIESQLPTRDSHKTTSIIDGIMRINGNVGGVDKSLDAIQKLHGPWTGSSSELVSFSKNLFGNDPEFKSGLLELEKGITELQSIKSNLDGIISDSRDLTLTDVSTALMRGYLRNVTILLPDGISKAISGELSGLPLFTQISESLGAVYHNFVVTDKGLDMVDGIIQSAIDESGLSSVLDKHAWIRMLPEYASNFHDNIRLFQRMGTRVLPKCTFGKLYHKMDEPLAHIYNLAKDVLNFRDIFDNRKKYLSILFKQYGDLIRKINNMYPICHEYSLDNTSKPIHLGGETIGVDILGNKKGGGTIGELVLLDETYP
jgi:hypothetical protein